MNIGPTSRLVPAKNISMARNPGLPIASRNPALISSPTLSRRRQPMFCGNLSEPVTATATT